MMVRGFERWSFSKGVISNVRGATISRVCPSGPSFFSIETGVSSAAHVLWSALRFAPNGGDLSLFARAAQVADGALAKPAHQGPGGL